MMHAAPAAPSAPAMVAVINPVLLKLDRPPWADSVATGTSTPIRKYATPTHNSAFRGFPSSTCPLCSNTPYAPHDRTAPATNRIHIRPLACAFALMALIIGDLSAGRVSFALPAYGPTGQHEGDEATKALRKIRYPKQ